MNESTLKAIRELCGSHEDNPTSENYCVRDSNGGMIMGWISRERAEEYSRYYPKSIVQEMPFNLNTL